MTPGAIKRRGLRHYDENALTRSGFVILTKVFQPVVVARHDRNLDYAAPPAFYAAKSFVIMTNKARPKPPFVILTNRKFFPKGG